jgi:O-methyltransferase involved in polyketide biosynthesis
MVIAEGVFGYLQEDDVRKALALVADQLSAATVAFDIAGGRNMAARGSQRVWPGLRARTGWSCEEAALVEEWELGYRLLESRSLFDVPPSLDRLLPFSCRWAMAVARVLGWEIDAYRLNIYRVGC